VLSGEDLPDWQGDASPFSTTHSDLSRLTARVSPNGRFLAFMSMRQLTGYDNRDAASGVPDEEVFMHDLDSGRTVCASCDPTGARPRGVLEPAPGEENSLLVDRSGVWAKRWVAATIPGWTPVKLASAQYQSRYLSDEGRLFFNTPVGLVAADANGRQDVYEFEPEGTGDCTGELSLRSAALVTDGAGGAVEGCLGLVSSGTSSEESVFLDAGGPGPGGHEGEDVFYLSAARLVAADTDDALDVYDAHVCSASSPCPASSSAVVPACTTTDSCRAAAPAQPAVFGAPASATFSGASNLTSAGPASATAKAKPATRAAKLSKALRACRKDRRKRKRAVCEKRAKRKYEPAKQTGKATRPSGAERSADR
jgi:hypothetical protein